MVEMAASMASALSAVQRNENTNTIPVQEASQSEQSGSFQTVLKNLYQSGKETMDSIFQEASVLYGVSEKLLKAVAKAESNFNASAVSKSGAIGVMQLMPATARSLGVTDPYDARQNIMGGAKYLKENLERFGGNVNFALAAYNAGPNAVQKYGGIPPYKETQNYVKTVNSYLAGDTIVTGKTVEKSSSASMLALSSPYGASLYGSSSLWGSGTTSSLSSSGAYGLLGSDAMGMLLGTAVASGDGENITISKESFVNLIQLLRLQMMMNATREVGSVNL